MENIKLVPNDFQMGHYFDYYNIIFIYPCDAFPVLLLQLV